MAKKKLKKQIIIKHLKPRPGLTNTKEKVSPAISDAEFEDTPHATLTTPQVRAAYYMAEGRLSVQRIAMDCHVSVVTIYAWYKREDFKAQVQEYKDIIQETFVSRNLIIKANRIAKLETHFADIETVKQERGESPEMQSVPGGKTGLLGREVKYYGKNADVAVTIYEFDSALDKAYRGTLSDIAREVGDIKDTQFTSGPTINGDVTVNQQNNNGSTINIHQVVDEHLTLLRRIAGPTTTVEGGLVPAAPSRTDEIVQGDGKT